MLDPRGDITRNITGTLVAVTLTAALLVPLALLGTGLALIVRELVGVISA